jgi:pimeloyl-ACP methyl ester carboxylesterase
MSSRISRSAGTRFAIVAAIALTVASILHIRLDASQNPAEKVDKQPPPFFITPEQGREIEKKLALPITAFYDTPPGFPAGKPGDLIRLEETDVYRFPNPVELKADDIGIKSIRFLYHSTAVNGESVPASGVVLIPNGKPPVNGWPVIVWSHGTSGVARQFAPSLMKDLYYGWQGLIQWTMLGYAVVAPDYAGLGTDVPHQYLAAPAQAYDIIHAVPAARKAVPQLGAKWVAIGHSQGGTAVLFVAEMEGTLKDPNYLGAVSLAPVGDLLPLCEPRNAQDVPVVYGYAAFLAYGIKAVYPKFEYSDCLEPEALKLMPVIKTGGWFTTLSTFAYGMQPGKLPSPNWKASKHFLEFRKLTLPGQRAAYGPVLLIQGLEDISIPTAVTDAAYERMKKQGWAVEYRKYPGLDHDPLVFGSFRDQFRWVETRFAAAGGK